jgi:hypothetical protein
MKSLVTTALLREFMQVVADLPVEHVSAELWAAHEALQKEDAIFMLDESYEISKIFNTPTHQVVMLKNFEEEEKTVPLCEWPEDQYIDEEDAYKVEYTTSYQITQIMFHGGVKISRSFGYEEEAERDKYWAKLSQEQAQKFVDATVKFIDDANSGK